MTPKCAPDRIGAGENFLHLGGTRVRCDVDVFWSLTADEIADAAAGKVGDVTGCAQSIDECACGPKHCFFLNPAGFTPSRSPLAVRLSRPGGGEVES